MKWMDLVKFIVPIAIAAVNPRLAPLSGVIVHGIDEAEALHGAGSGAEKLAHVVNLAVLSAQGVNAGTGKIVVDPQEVQTTAGHVIDAAISAANLLHRTPQAGS